MCKVWIQDAEPPGAAASLSGISSSSSGCTKQASHQYTADCSSVRMQEPSLATVSLLKICRRALRRSQYEIWAAYLHLVSKVKGASSQAQAEQKAGAEGALRRSGG